MPLTEILTAELLPAAALVAVAGLLRGFAGFGSAMLMVPGLAALYGPTVSVPTVAILELLVTVQLIAPATRRADRAIVGWAGGVSLLTLPLGVWILVSADPLALRYAMSALILVMVVLLAGGLRRRGRATRAGMAGIGAFSGLTAGATGLGGPALILYLLSGQEKAERVRASLICIFGMMSVVGLANIYLQGILDLPIVLRAAVLLPLFLLGAWIGGRGFGRADEALYRRVGLVVVAATALLALLV